MDGNAFINSRKASGLEFLSCEVQRNKFVYRLGNRMRNLGVSGANSLLQSVVVQFHFFGTQAVSSVEQK